MPEVDNMVQIKEVVMSPAYSTLDTYWFEVSVEPEGYAVFFSTVEEAVVMKMGFKDWAVEGFLPVHMFLHEGENTITIEGVVTVTPMTDKARDEWVVLIREGKVSPTQITEKITNILGADVIREAFSGHVEEGVKMCYKSISTSQVGYVRAWCVDVGCRFGEYADLYCPVKVGMKKEVE